MSSLHWMLIFSTYSHWEYQMVYLYCELPPVLRIEVSLDEVLPIINLIDICAIIVYNYETWIIKSPLPSQMSGHLCQFHCMRSSLYKLVRISLCNLEIQPSGLIIFYQECYDPWVTFTKEKYKTINSHKLYKAYMLPWKACQSHNNP